MQSPRNSLECVQWLRAFAAFLVVIYHVEVQLNRLFVGRNVEAGFGAAGVDLFFVISGFVMVLSTTGKTITFAEFMRRRIVRIVPLYWVFTSATLAIALIAPHLLNSTRLAVPHVLASYLMLPYPHPVLGVDQPLLVPGWTLNYELYFYAVFGLLLWMPLERRIFAIGSFFGIFCLLVFLGQGMGGGQGIWTPLRFYGAPIVLEFVCGMWVARVYLGSDPPSRAGVALLAAIAVAIAGLGVASGVTEEGHRVLFWGPVATIVLLLCVMREREQGWPHATFLKLLGDASYSLYLSHLFVLAACAAIIAKTGLASSLGPAGVRLLLLCASVVAAIAVYKLLEQPLLKIASGRRDATRARSHS